MENKIIEIYQKYKKNILDKNGAVDRIISVIENIQKHNERYEALKALGEIKLKDERIFPFLESLFLSDSNEKIRIIAAKIIRQDYIDLAYNPMKWALNHETSPESLKEIHECLMQILTEIKNDNTINYKEYLIEEISDIKNKEFRVGFEILKEKKEINTLKKEVLIKVLVNYYTLVYLEKAYWRVKYSLNNLEIVKLDFIFKGLNSIPCALKYLTSINSLIFRYNQITSIPEWIGRLKLLKTLNFNVNELHSLPNSIGQLKALKEFYLWKNNLEILPNSLGDLEYLEILNLRLNYISYLPSSIGKLKSLKELNLHDNKLTALPPTIGNLNNLQKLNLSWNMLKELPRTIGNLFSLKTLDLGRNELKELPETIGNLNKLNTLILSENQLKHLPNEIIELKNLKHLNVARNRLISLPEGLDSMPKLEELYISENNIDSFSSLITKLEHNGVKIFL